MHIDGRLGESLGCTIGMALYKYVCVRENDNAQSTLYQTFFVVLAVRECLEDMSSCSQTY